MKALVITEKPSVAKDIAKVLKCTKKGDGYIQGDEYIITWAIGHLVALCNPDEYNENLKKWNMNTLPIIPKEIKLKAIENTRRQLEILYKLMNMNDVSSLICATDSGREGELIFRYIYKVTKCDKPFKRLWISSMTDESIKKGFSNLKDGEEYDNLYYSAKCRSEADWLVGINASRAFSLKFNTHISIGRVQTPTLAILVDRYNEIKQFEVKEYFEIDVNFETNQGIDEEEKYKSTWIDLNNNDTKIFDKNKSLDILNCIKDKNGIVKSVENETKKQQAPFLYDLTELQRECNKKFSYSAQKTLSIAQDLYEKRKLITYPRTDSRHLSDDMVPVIKSTIDKLSLVSEYTQFTDYILSLNEIPITKRIVDNSKITDHHAIIPTINNININSLSKDEFNVYNLVARRFMAVFFPNYVYGSTKIITSIEEHNFITRGTSIIDMGWTKLNILSEKEKNDKKKEELIPNLTKDEIVINKKCEALQKKTKPPAYYNEATLLSAMENAGRFVEDENLKEQLKESGLGTPATRASIIERLINVSYIERKGKSLIPTEKGLNLISVIPKELRSAETTGKWERGLSLISKGDMESEKFMGSISRYVNFLVDYAKRTQSNVVFKEEPHKNKPSYKKLPSFGKCLNCDGDVLENTKSFYCEHWRTGCKFSIWKNALERYNVDINKDIVVELLKNKKISNVKIINPKTNLEESAEIILSEKGVNINL